VAPEYDKKGRYSRRESSFFKAWRKSRGGVQGRKRWHPPMCVVVESPKPGSEEALGIGLIWGERNQKGRCKG